MTEETVGVTAIIVLGVGAVILCLFFGGEPDLMDAIKSAIECKP